MHALLFPKFMPGDATTDGTDAFSPLHIFETDLFQSSLRKMKSDLQSLELVSQKRETRCNHLHACQWIKNIISFRHKTRITI